MANMINLARGCTSRDISAQAAETLRIGVPAIRCKAATFAIERPEQGKTSYESQGLAHPCQRTLEK
jgi:hypothetical protein